MDFLKNKSAVPDVELSEEDLDALGSLSKTNVKGLKFNPYDKIDPKHLSLSAVDDEDDDEWFYATDEQKPRARHEKLFLNVGSATLIGGGFGIAGALVGLRRKNMLNMATFKHRVKRSEFITSNVENVRLRAGQGGSFGFWIGGTAALMDMQSIKKMSIVNGLAVGDLNFSVGGSAALGGFLYGLFGSKFYSNDVLRTKARLMKQFPEFPAGKPSMIEMNKRTEYWVLSRCINKDKVPKWVNLTSGLGRCSLLGMAAYTLTAGLDAMSTTKIGWIRDLKRWKW